MIRRNTPMDFSEHQRLVDLARGYAEHMMRSGGSVRPVLLADTAEGTILYLPETMGNERSKQNFANTARLIAVGYGATAVAFVFESWITFAKPGRPLDSTPPSESPDREECVLISAETRHRQATEILMIQRDRTGKFVGFATPDVPEVTGFKGRFSQIMPPKPPGEKEIVMARQLLSMMGVEPENRGSNPMWN
jgi:hypothetical protein